MEKVKLVRGGKTLALRRRDDAFIVYGGLKNLALELGSDRRVEVARALSPNALFVRGKSLVQAQQVLLEVRRDLPATTLYEMDDAEVVLPFIPTIRIAIGTVDNQDPIALGLESSLTKLGLRRIAVPVSGAYFRYATSGTVDPIIVCAELINVTGIVFAEPDRLVSLIAGGGPTWFDRQWHLNGKFISNGYQSYGANVIEAWNFSKGDPEVVLAVLDDGFDLSNPDLSGNMRNGCDFAPLAEIPNLPEPFTPADSDPSANRSIGDFHGTPCAGLAIARGIKNVSGVAPNCAWLPARTRFSLASEDLLLRSIEYLSSRCDVLSCSWGTLPSPYESPSSSMIKTFETLIAQGGRRKKGLVVCFAAGNKNLPTTLSADKNTAGFEYYDTAGRKLGTFFKGKAIHSSWTEVPGVIVVGAVNAVRKKSKYSNWGDCLTVVAPSDDWDPAQPPEERKSQRPKLVTCDNEMVGLGMFELGAAMEEMGYVTDSMSGTSGATPIVAGVCGLIISNAPFATAADVLSIILESADKDGLVAELDNQASHNNNAINGSFDSHTGHSPWYGAGAIDASKAVKIARG